MVIIVDLSRLSVHINQGRKQRTVQSRFQLNYINRQENPPIGPKTNDITDDHFNLKPANSHSFKSWVFWKGENVQEVE